MTWKERRIIYALVVILAVLLAALMIVLSGRFRASRAAQENVPASEVSILETEVEFSALSYYNGATTLSFERSEQGNWFWTDDPAFPLDTAQVERIVSTLQTLTPMQTLTMDAETDYGFDAPSATITATTTDGGTLQLKLGKATDSANGYYVYQDGDVPSLFIFGNALYDVLQMPIYDMMLLPELPALQENALEVISLLGHASEEGQEAPFTILTAIRSEGDAASATWRSNGADVTKSKTVRSLLKELSALTPIRCVDYHPSDAAVTLCGFDDPAAVLVVSYFDEQQAEQILTVRFGGTSPDGGGRYVRFQEDPSIYLVDTATISTLLALAENGLLA